MVPPLLHVNMGNKKQDTSIVKNQFLGGPCHDNHHVVVVVVVDPDEKLK